MANNEKLNSNVIKYQSGDREVFRDIYEALTLMRNGWLAKASGRYLDDRATREAAFDDTLLKSLAAYDSAHERGFVEYMSGNLRRANASIYRTVTRNKLACEVPDAPVYPDETESITLLDTIVDADANPEDIVMKEQKKRDHRQVISILLADQSEVVKNIAINRVMYESDNALAKALGVHHMVVKRTWKKIAERYDANRFGPICQYLA